MKDKKSKKNKDRLEAKPVSKESLHSDYDESWSSDLEDKHRVTESLSPFPDSPAKSQGQLLDEVTQITKAAVLSEIKPLLKQLEEIARQAEAANRAQEAQEPSTKVNPTDPRGLMAQLNQQFLDMQKLYQEGLAFQTKMGGAPVSDFHTRVKNQMAKYQPKKSK